MPEIFYESFLEFFSAESYNENRFKNEGDAMKTEKSGKAVVMMLLVGVSLLTVGCSRSTINYQIAESIGTVGMYENNEPVETPQMQVEREQKESQQTREAGLQAKLDEAQKLAEGYWYEEASALLGELTGEEAQDERVVAALASYQEAKDSMTVYEGDIPHLCFPGLIEDTMRAFDGDDMSYTYDSSMVTTKEFKAILQSLYDNNYILIDIHSIAAETTDARGVTMLEQHQLMLPKGKKPVIISQDNLNYSGIKNGDGIATGLVLDSDGNVKARYTDDGGHELKGDYDLVPILNTFVEEHPDFSMQGARGIVSVSVSEGIFGYEIADSGAVSNEDNRNAVTAIAQKLTADGWDIACAGYSHGYMNDMDTSALQTDIGKWLDEAGSLVGDTDILFYPYGAEVEYPSDQLNCLIDQGFIYLCGLWGDTDYMDIQEKYMRQTRRFVDGYTLEHAPEYFSSFFTVSSILDSDR